MNATAHGTIAIKAPLPYLERLRQVALCLDLSLAGLARISIERYAEQHPDLPPALVQDLQRLGAQVTTRPPTRVTPFVDSTSAATPLDTVEG